MLPLTAASGLALEGDRGHTGGRQHDEIMISRPHLHLTGFRNALDDGLVGRASGRKEADGNDDDNGCEEHETETERAMPRDAPELRLRRRRSDGGPSPAVADTRRSSDSSLPLKATESVARVAPTIVAGTVTIRIWGSRDGTAPSNPASATVAAAIGEAMTPHCEATTLAEGAVGAGCPAWRDTSAMTGSRA